MDKLTFFIVYVGLCYLVGMWGAKKEIGIKDSFLISLMLTPIVGMIVVWRSDKKMNDPFMTGRRTAKPELNEQEQKEYSAILKLYHKGKITKEEFDSLTAKYTGV